MNRFSEPSSSSSNILTFADRADTDPTDSLLSNLEDPIFTPASDEFEDQVEAAQQQLEELRRQQEAIELQKAEIEHLRAKQTDFQRGRVEMLENLQHALDVLDRDQADAEQRLELYSGARETFSKHLDTLANMRPETWERDELADELELACGCVTEAREEFEASLSRLDMLADTDVEKAVFTPVGSAPAAASPMAEEGPVATADTRDFRYWMRSGLAFTLPMMVFGCFALMLMLMFG